MKRILISIFGAWLVLISCMPAWSGTLTTNGFLYKPETGARGVNEKNAFAVGLERVDDRLGKEIWVGDPNYGPNFQNALTAIGSNDAILRLPAGTHSINADVIVPANITLKPERGAILSIATGKTLAINGGFEAGLYQTFAGTGKVVFGSAATIYPEWWGAMGNNSNDDRASIQGALDCLQNGAGGSLVFSGKTYKINSFHPTLGVYVDGYGIGNMETMLAVGSNSGSYKTIKIIGRDGTTLTSPLLPGSEAVCGVTLSLLGQLQNVSIEGVTFAHTHGLTAKATTAINVYATQGYQVKYLGIANCRFQDFSNAVHIPNCDNPIVEKNFFASDLGRDSGSTTMTMPNVAVRSEVSSRNVKVINNDFDGCVTGTVASNTGNKIALDGLYFGTAQGVIVSGNTIRHHAYEGIYVLPTSDATHNYSAIIEGNIIDSLPVTGTVAPESFPSLYYSIRCDESNSLIQANIINNASRGITVQRESSYAADIYRGRITDNIINMCGSSFNTYWGIFLNSVDGYSLNIHDFEITNNSIYWPSYASQQSHLYGILINGDGHRILSNVVKSGGPYGSGCALNGITFSAHGSGYVKGNKFLSCYYGISGLSDSIITIDENDFTGCIVPYQISQLTGLVWHPGFLKAKAILNASQTVASGSAVKVTFDTVSFDSGSIIDTTNHRIKPTTPGYYQVHGHITNWTSAVPTNILLYLYKNGSSVALQYKQSPPINFVTMEVSDLIYFNGTTDYVELWFSQDSGVNSYIQHDITQSYLTLVGPF